MRTAPPMRFLPVLVLAGAAWAASSPQSTINTYCVGCHNNRAKTGGLSLEGKSLDVSADPETWEKVIKKLQLGVMPPAGSPRPDAEVYAGLLRDLTTRLDAASQLLRSLNAPVSPVRPAAANKTELTTPDAKPGAAPQQ
jgi:hypothetical protein